MYKVYSVKQSDTITVYSDFNKTLIIQHDNSKTARTDCEKILQERKNYNSDLQIWSPTTKLTLCRYINFSTMEYFLCGFIIWTSKNGVLWVLDLSFKNTMNNVFEFNIRNYALGIFQEWVQENFDLQSWKKFRCWKKIKLIKNINIKKYYIMNAEQIQLRDKIKVLETELRELKKNKTYQKLIIKVRSPHENKQFEKYKLEISRKNEFIRNLKSQLDEIEFWEEKKKYNDKLRNPANVQNQKHPENPAIARKTEKIAGPISRNRVIYKHKQRNLNNRVIRDPMGNPPERYPEDPPVTILPHPMDENYNAYYDPTLDHVELDTHKYEAREIQENEEDSSSSENLSLDI